MKFSNFSPYYYLQVLFAAQMRMTYRKIRNISPGLIEVRKPFFGGLYSGGLYLGGPIFGGHFVLVSEYQDLKIHCYISLL